MNLRWAEAPELADAAAMVSRAFLASPVFAGVDAVRYQPEPIERSMTRGRTLLAFDPSLIGSITLFFPDPASPCEAFRSAPSFGLLAVEPSYGGRGAGARLVAAVESLSAQEGHPEIALSVTQRGTELIEWYERLGYRRVGEFMWPHAVDPSLILMKPLAAIE